MTTIEQIQDRVKRFNYKNLAEAIFDMRVLLDELKRLRDENARLMASRDRKDL